MKRDPEHVDGEYVDGEHIENTSPRRQFLRRSAIAAGGLALGLQVEAQSAEQESADTTQKQGDLSLPLDKHPALVKVGGSEVIETASDKIIVARTGETSFAACSAICTHKQCIVRYQHGSRQFVCPCHQARFALDGKVLRGPAKTPLKSYPISLAVVVKTG